MRRARAHRNDAPNTRKTAKKNGVGDKGLPYVWCANIAPGRESKQPPPCGRYKPARTLLSPPDHVDPGTSAAVVHGDVRHLAGLVEQGFCQVSAADAAGSREERRRPSVVVAHGTRHQYHRVARLRAASSGSSKKKSTNHTHAALLLGPAIYVLDVRALSGSRSAAMKHTIQAFHATTLLLSAHKARHACPVRVLTRPPE